jgi:hypothetical protein
MHSGPRDRAVTPIATTIVIDEDQPVKIEDGVVYIDTEAVSAAFAAP